VLGLLIPGRQELKNLFPSQTWWNLLRLDEFELFHDGFDFRETRAKIKNNIAVEKRGLGCAAIFYERAC